MAPEKAPAFQFYPKDYLSDPRVRAMSFEQRGLYWESICLCWMEGTLPADMNELAAILRCPVKRIRKIWPLIGRCFDQHGDRLTHKRLDKERTSQAESRDRRADAARKRWEKEQKADAMHMQSNAGEPSPVDAKQCSSSPSSSTTSSPSSTAVKEHAAPLIMSPLVYERRKQQCTFVGSRLEVPIALHADLRKNLGGADPDAVLQSWYLALNEEIEQSGEPIAPDVFKWLKARFATWVQCKITSDKDAKQLARLQAIERGERKY